MPRTHVVLVPGFGGFDALGGLRYYAGITSLFRTWQDHPTAWPTAGREPVPWAGATRPRRDATVLHYFDNEPTAGVSTRAERLRVFLGKLVARGAIDLGTGRRRGDRIALVGHSTGGLDIRWLLRRLSASPPQLVDVDGLGPPPTGGVDHRPLDADLLRAIERVVFLSVPHRGTNLAQWLDEHPRVVPGLVGALRRGLGLPHRVVDTLLTPLLRLDGDAGLALAGGDVSAAVERVRDVDPVVAAAARQERSDVALWLDDAAADFLALRELRVHDPADARGPDARAWFEADLAAWPAHVETLAFATRGAVGLPSAVVGPAPTPLRSARALPRTLAAALVSPSVDAFYGLGWWLCSAGPFAAGRIRTVVDVRTGKTLLLDDPDNDGVVNTASMIWPSSLPTRLVDGDHADVMGHFATRALAGPADAGRRHASYDLLGSASAWTDASLVRVWREAFDFSAA